MLRALGVEAGGRTIPSTLRREAFRRSGRSRARAAHHSPSRNLTTKREKSVIAGRRFCPEEKQSCSQRGPAQVGASNKFSYKCWGTVNGAFLCKQATLAFTCRP